MVSILLGVWNGGGVCCCCPSQCSGVARALLIPLQCWRVLLSCRALFHCQVCGVWVVSVSVLFVWWGILCLLPPRRGGGWGHRGWWGAVVDGGWHGEGRAAVLLASPSCVWCPPSVCVVVLLNGGSGVLSCCPLCLVVPVLFIVFPVFGLGPAPSCCYVPLTLSCSSHIILFPFPCRVLPCLLWVGKCGVCVGGVGWWRNCVRRV